ncbi:MAG: hypothetical protein WA160_12245 [Pseudobdellovibrio sp.]
MFKKTDPYSFTTARPLQIKDKDPTVNGQEYDTVGSISIDYQVTLYNDVQANDSASVSKSSSQRFVVNCTQRVALYNIKGKNLNPSKDLNIYSNYPALIQTGMALDVDRAKTSMLLDYSPQTVNTVVNASQSDGSSDGVTKGSASSSSVGSSVSQTNSFGVSITAGEFTGGITESYGYSKTTGSEKSSTNSTDSSNSNNRDSSSSASMSIKDWGAYALVDPNSKTPSWTFGQEYPWDAIKCRNSTTDGTGDFAGMSKISVPTSVNLRLWDQVCLYPPSELSMFGVNFVMNSSWLVIVPNSESNNSTTISHNVDCWTGSHAVETVTTTVNDVPTSTKAVAVYLDSTPTTLQIPANLDGTDLDATFSTELNLNIMALDPIGVNTTTAVTGFIPKKFIISPENGKFKIISSTNDLMIQNTTEYAEGAAIVGFASSQTYLQASLSSSCPKLQMTMYFKAIDSVRNYTLYMKHWKASASGVKLTITMNGDTDEGCQIIKYVDASEAEGGEGNLLSIALRNQNFASVDYHDYLQLGLNSIQVEIEPIGTDMNCVYQIRAMSIEIS